MSRWSHGIHTRKFWHQQVTMTLSRFGGKMMMIGTAPIPYKATHLLFGHWILMLLVTILVNYKGRSKENDDGRLTFGLIVSGSDDQTLRIWRTIKPQNAQGIPTPSHDPTYRTVCTLSGYHNRCIYSVSWSKVNNHIASASGDNSVRVFVQVGGIHYKSI